MTPQEHEQPDPFRALRVGWRLRARKARDTWLPGTLAIEAALDDTFRDGVKFAAEILEKEGQPQLAIKIRSSSPGEPAGQSPGLDEYGHLWLVRRFSKRRSSPSTKRRDSRSYMDRVRDLWTLDHLEERFAVLGKADRRGQAPPLGGDAAVVA